MKPHLLFFFWLLILFSACQFNETDEQVSANDQMRNEVREYLFLPDSVAVKVEVADTVTTTELDGMLTTLDENLNLIQQDIDTLAIMMDDRAYNLLNEAESAEEKLQTNEDVTFLKYSVKMAELEAKRLSFQQTKRVMLHLKRSVQGEIAGYEVNASYVVQDQENKFKFLMNPEFRIID